jgi:hypothetical protein
MSDATPPEDVLDVVIRRLHRFYGAAETAMELAWAARACGIRGKDPATGSVIWEAPATDEERCNLNRIQELWAQARQDFRDEGSELLALATALGTRLEQRPFDPQAVHNQLRLQVHSLYDHALRYVFIVSNPFAWSGTHGDEMRELYGDNWRQNIDRAIEPLRQLHRLLTGMREATGMSVAEAEQLLELDKGSIRRLAAAKQIEGVKEANGEWSLLRSSVQAYAAKQRSKTRK